jgi:hypothetical protein
MVYRDVFLCLDFSSSASTLQLRFSFPTSPVGFHSRHRLPKPFASTHSLPHTTHSHPSTIIMRPSIRLFALPSMALAFLSPGPLHKRDSWGGSVSLGPTKSTIINAVTTIIPGAAPPTQNGMLFLWPGMSNGTGDLVQTTLESWPDNSWCGATTGQWCIRASIFGSFGQLDGSAGVVKGTDKVKIEYNLEADGETWKQ